MQLDCRQRLEGMLQAVIFVLRALLDRELVLPGFLSKCQPANSIIALIQLFVNVRRTEHYFRTSVSMAKLCTFTSLMIERLS